MEDFSLINGEGTPLHEAQQVMLDILLEFDRVCKKHNLTYWIDFGTLLGAVRHQGFVPWDDDIDVSMPTQDFRRFQELGTQELQEGFFLQNEKTDPGSDMSGGIFKIRKDNTFFVNDFDNFRRDYHKGIAIDVFESVPYPTLPKKTFHFIRRRIQKSYGFFRYNPPLNFKNICCYFIYPISNVIFAGLWKLICKIKKNDRELTPINRLIYGYPSLQSAIYPVGEIEFCGHKVPCPHDPDTRLRDMYGDYMQLPPKDKWRVHSKFICTDTHPFHTDL